MQTTEVLATVRLWTIAEYHQMAAAGIFHPDERVELVAGQIVRMSAKRTAHTASVRRTARLLHRLFEGQAEVYTQDPIQLNNFSEPEPDIAVVRPDPLDYANAHPTASDVFLIVEVADSSFKYDREIKGKAYAESAILDYWVLDINNRRLPVFREPTPDGYQSEVVLSAESTVSLLHSTRAIAVLGMLPPS